MHFLDSDRVPPYDLTYDDVFMVPRRSAVASRDDVDLSTDDGTGATAPLVVANMTAVSGRRMAETVARRGGLAVIPQDIPATWSPTWSPGSSSGTSSSTRRSRLAPHHTVADALALIPKRAHRAAFVVEDGRPVGVVTEEDCERRGPVHPGAPR